MGVIEELLSNRIMWVGVLGWFVAQLIKVILTVFVEKRFDPGRFFGLGGMPSSHSCMIVSVTIATGMRMGFNSALFAISFCLSCIIMTDAAGVRRQAGRQAEVLNRVVQELIQHGGDLPEETLKELLGHTPLQVAVGAVLGVLIALIAARG